MLVRVEDHDGTAVLTFSRPPANAFNLGLTEELHERLQQLAADPPSGGLVLTGDGMRFSGGVDFKEVPRYSDEQRARMIQNINACITLLYGIATATVAAVNGSAIGGAFVVVLACDARLAAQGEVRLGLTEVTAGIPYPACPMEVVAAELEPAYRRHLVLSGEVVSPAQAAEHGLFDAILAPGELLARAIELARARAGAASYAVVKRQLKRRTLERMREIVATGSDPMLQGWL